MGKRKSQVLLDSDDSDSKSSGSGSDLEKEMLSLSKKKKSTAAAGNKKAKQDDDSDSDSSGSDLDWNSKAKGKKRKKTKKGTGKRAARRSMSGTYSSDSDDDGASSVAPPSEKGFKKASDLEEGEVDSDSSAEEFDDGYDDNLYGDAEDRARLNQMSEKEREQELFKRLEQREALKTRFEIEKKLRQAKKNEMKRQEKAELAANAKLMKTDAKERSKERKKTVESKVDKKTQALDALIAKREARKERAEEKQKEIDKRKDDSVIADDDLDLKDDTASSAVGEKTKKKLKASDIYSDDSGSDYEEERQSKVKKESDDSHSSGSESESESRQKVPQYVSKVEDLNKIRISRFKMEKWAHLPFFARVLKGCFVRVGIGHNHNIMKSVYRIGEILDVVETPKIYQIGSTRTNKGVKIRHGTDEKVFRFEFVSNSDITADEFQKWREACERKGVTLPTLDDVTRKVKEIKEANEYQFKEEDIEHIIQEKQKFKQAPVNFAAKKTTLLKEKEVATQLGDEARAEEINQQIQELDERAKELDKIRTSSISSISYINVRNRKKNVEEAEKAILEELKQNKGKMVDDPFTRRNTKPRIVHRSVELEMMNNAAMELENATKSSQESKDETDGFTFKEPLPPKVSDTTITADSSLDMESDCLDFENDLLTAKVGEDGKDIVMTREDLFSAHDFDIKLDIDAKLPPSLPIVARPSVTPVKEPAPRRSLNLEDYKRKRGLI